MSETVKRGVLSWMKRRALLAFGVVLPVALFILAAPVAAGMLTAAEGLAVVLAALLGCVLFFLISLYEPRRFVRMIRRQEALLGVSFGDEDFTPALPRAGRLDPLYCASANWYMCEGSWAFHRLYMTQVTPKSELLRGGRRRHIALVRTIDGKTWKLYMSSASDLKRFRQWCE